MWIYVSLAEAFNDNHTCTTALSSCQLSTVEPRHEHLPSASTRTTAESEHVNYAHGSSVTCTPCH